MFSSEKHCNDERFTDSDKCTDFSSLIEETHYNDTVFRNHKLTKNVVNYSSVNFPGGGPRLSEISCTYDPPIYDITSGCRVAALFSREAQRWTHDAIWFPRYFYPQANGIMYLESREY